MKLKYVLSAFVAALGVMFFTSCDNDYDATYLSEVQVSQSIIGLSADGGQATISVDAVDAWAFANVPEWLTITPSTGEAGVTDVTFSAPATTETHDDIVLLVSAGREQRIRVRQIAAKVEVPVSPIADVIAGGDGTYRVTGTCVTSADNKYGNWYIEDETGRIYVYGTYDQKGGKGTYPISGANGWDFGVGDIVTIEGPKTVYNGTPEFVDVTVINITKSLVKVDSISAETIDIEGGDIVAHLTSKGNGLSVIIPEDAQSWLNVTGIETSGTLADVTLRASANDGGDRSTTVTFRTTQGGKEYTAETTVSQKGAIVAATVAEFNAAAENDTQYRLVGVVTDLYASDAQGQSFYIADYSGQTLVYRAAGFKESGAKVGDVVTVVGKRTSYRDTPQVGSGTFEELTHVVTEVSVADFLTKEDNANVYYKVTGTITEIANDNYGNLYLQDGDATVYVYGTYPGWGATGNNRTGLIAAKGIKVGDKLTVIGVKSTYNGTVQVANSIYFSHEEGTSDEPEVDPNALGQVNNPYDVPGIIAAIEAGTVEGEVYVKGKVSEIANNGQFSAQYGNGTFWISTDGVRHNDVTLDFEAYRVLWLGNQKWVEGDDPIAVGDEVVLCGQVVKYTNANSGAVTYETSQNNAYVYSVNGKTK